MAAGDIITSKGYIFTPEDIAMFTSPIQERIATTAKDPGEFELVESLQGISSLPVFFQSGASYRLVRVAVSILRGVDGREVHLQVSEAGYIQWRWSDGMWQNLIALADLKGDKGETPTFRTGTSGIEWKYLSEGEDAWKMLVSYDVLKLKFSDLTAEQIAEFWRQIPADVLALFQQPAVDAAARADEKLIQISEDVKQTQEKLVEDAGKVNTDLTKSVDDLKKELSTSTAEVISATNTAKNNAIAATGIAMSVSDNPGYIGDDYHVYQWDYTVGNYVKTDRVLRPEAFGIYRQYASIELMEADKVNVPEGKFVIINVGSVEQGDNARLYVKGATDYEYLVDMSGAIGFTGKTPQISIGTVTTGAAGSQASASLSPDGTDEDGNPKYKLNQIIPQGLQGFTPELSIGAVTTGLPGTQASVVIINKGIAESGAPKKEFEFTIPAGEAGNIEGIYQTREIDHEPTPEDVIYSAGGKDHPYPIGAEVYYRTAEEVIFYKLYDLKDGKAVWNEAGSGTALPGNIYLQGATYYNDSVRIIKGGYLNE